MTVLADSTYVDWSSMGKILLISIAAGAGLVSVYSLGLLALSASGYVRREDDASQPQRNVLALVAAVICLCVVVAAAIYGIRVIFEKG
jgi:ABC-type nickel/cobalt efflux system permease component RcnA